LIFYFSVNPRYFARSSGANRRDERSQNKTQF
jgi:hypothetical protein